MPSDNPPAPEFSVLLDNNDMVKVIRIRLKPGAVIPRHTEKVPYVMFPKSTGRLRRTYYKNNEAVREVVVDIHPDHPYFTGPMPPDEDFECRNEGDTEIVLDKGLLRIRGGANDRKG